MDEYAGGLNVERTLRDRAYARALALLNDPAPGVVSRQVALVGFARDMLCEVAVELAARPGDLRSLVHHLETEGEISVLELGRELLRAPQLLRLPVAVAVEVALTLLLAFAGARAVSLWRLSSARELECIACVGNVKAARLRTRQLALRALAAEGVEAWYGSSLGAVTIGLAEGPAALIACGPGACAAQHRLVLEAAIPLLTVALERESLLKRARDAERNPRGGREQPGAAERRLARLRFDLHDGPQQDVMLLAEDLRLFRTQLGSVLIAKDKRERLLGRIDDLEARLVALDGDLRRISVSAESPFLHGASLKDALAQVTDSFAERTGIEPEIRLHGDLTGFSDSQHITLLGLIREALSNVREHGDARHVVITLSAGPDGVEATVTDDGRGFDPEVTLVKAARGGHLGLVGMHERVRMLGGDTRIDSRPGGPTVISVRLPPAPAGVQRRTG